MQDVIEFGIWNFEFGIWNMELRIRRYFFGCSCALDKFNHILDTTSSDTKHQSG